MGFFPHYRGGSCPFSFKVEGCVPAGLVKSAQMGSDAVWKGQCTGVVMPEATRNQVLGIIFISFSTSLIHTCHQV